MERELGVQLFNEAAQGGAHTPGRVFVEGAEVVNHVDRLVALVEKSAREVSGASQSWLFTLLQRSLALFADFGDKSRFQIARESDASQCRTRPALRASARAGSPGGLSTGTMFHPLFRSETLFSEEFLVAFDRDYPLAKRASLSFADLAGEPVVWLRPDFDPWLRRQRRYSTCAPLATISP